MHHRFRTEQNTDTFSDGILLHGPFSTRPPMPRTRAVAMPPDGDNLGIVHNKTNSPPLQPSKTCSAIACSRCMQNVAADRDVSVVFTGSRPPHHAISCAPKTQTGVRRCRLISVAVVGLQCADKKTKQQKKCSKPTTTDPWAHCAIVCLVFPKPFVKGKPQARYGSHLSIHPVWA